MKMTGQCIFDKRIAVRSAGRPRHREAVEMPAGPHLSRLCNALIAGEFHRAGAVEIWDRGTNCVIDECRRYGAAQRPLLNLELVAGTPSTAAALSGLALPLGADTLTLTVSASGESKDGGNINFAANDVKPTHPTRPLTIAQTVYNALTEGSSFEASLKLGFGTAGRTGLQDQLQRLADEAPDDVTPRALFDKPVGGNR